MSYDPRTIAYHAEILFPPMALRAEAVQGVHNSLYHRPAVSYQSFQVAPDGIHLANPPQSPGMVSSVSFLPDRMVAREEFRACTVEEFASRIVNVASTAFPVLGITTSLAQQFVIRSLVNPKHFRDGREFLSRRLIAPETDAWSVFGRPVQALGLRIQIPPVEDHRESFQVRVESWLQDPRSIWIETIGSFANPTPTENLPVLSNYLHSTYRFLTGPVGEFLSRFDRP
ncbi:MAG: hypothetical protein Fur0037_03970 [Planctomycetota bacterium]